MNTTAYLLFTATCFNFSTVTVEEHKLGIYSIDVKENESCIAIVPPAVSWHEYTNDMKYHLLMTAEPGKYDISVIKISLTDRRITTVRNKICFEVRRPPKAQPPEAQPPEARPPEARPQQALARVRFGTIGCTATVIYPRRPDGRWEMLTAAHCVPKIGVRGSATIDGRTLGVSVVTWDKEADLAWLVTESSVDELPFAFLGDKPPPKGIAVWHAGFGIDKPGNKEVGVSLGEIVGGQAAYSISVSSGDSGGGIFRMDSGRLVGAVCCTTRRGALGKVYAGTPERAIAIRPSNSVDNAIREGLVHPILYYPDNADDAE